MVIHHFSSRETSPAECAGTFQRSAARNRLATRGTPSTDRACAARRCRCAATAPARSAGSPEGQHPARRTPAARPRRAAAPRPARPAPAASAPTGPPHLHAQACASRVPLNISEEPLPPPPPPQRQQPPLAAWRL
eukprot:350888-Chlamydomonas_euryale.AAC.6